MDTPFPTLISRLKEAIFARRPVLKEIMMKHGHESLSAYAERYHDVSAQAVFAERREEFLAIVEEDTKRLLDADVAARLVAQLRRLPVVSTADHHGPLVHPLFLNSNILFSLPFADNHDALLPVFAFSSVSINNHSSYGRGILFHTTRDGAPIEHRFPIFPDREKMCTVFGLRAFTKSDIDRTMRRITSHAHTRTFSSTMTERVLSVLTHIFSSPSALSHPTFSEQITVVNHGLWKKFFHDTPYPSFVALDVERLITTSLLRHHLPDSNSIFSAMLFNPSVRRLVWEYFCGIEGVLQHDRGTHFFWARDPKGHRVSLFEQHGVLRSREGTITIPLTVESITDALQSGRIFPSMLFSYLLLNFHYGFRCLGGFSQINTLSQMKLAWRALLTTLGSNENLDAIRSLDVRLMNDGLTVAYAAVGNTIIPAAGLDLFLHGSKASLQAIHTSADRLTVAEGFLPALPEIYRVLYHDTERNPELLSITPEYIIDAFRLREKIVPCVTIPENVSVPVPSRISVPVV